MPLYDGGSELENLNCKPIDFISLLFFYLILLLSLFMLVVCFLFYFNLLREVLPSRYRKLNFPSIEQGARNI